MTTSISSIIKGILISFITTIVFLLIFSIILTYTDISESFITPTIIVITAISIFIGSTISNSKIQRNGLLNGAIVGGIYLISIYLLSSIINQKFILSMQSIIMIISGIVCGMFGGILGVNKSR